MTPFRINGKNALKTVLKQEKNIDTIEKYIYQLSSKDKINIEENYNSNLYQIIGDIIDELKLNLPACVINIGGIANITYWDGKKLIGFDTGPGNCLMDKYIKIRANTYYDLDGLIASNGKSKKKASCVS